MNDIKKIWSVTEVTQTVKGILEETFYPLWVTGETGNFTAHRSAHVYFTLKDKKCQISCVFFNGADIARQNNIKEGMEVEVFGKLTVYEPRGNYQLTVRQIRPKGIGELQQKFEALKQKLLAEGLFADERKQKIPYLPKCIGVITSSDGAALRDFLQIINRRFQNMHIRIYPAAVQGNGAAQQIVEGLNYFNLHKSSDVIVVTRGGGSLEDLWAFNEESLARAIAGSNIPVISAVGHEIDFTICDFVADLRVPTPSAAAELVVGHKEELLMMIKSLKKRLTQAMRIISIDIKARVERAANHYILKEPVNMVRLFQQKVDELNIRLANQAKSHLNQNQETLHRLLAQLRVLDPINVLARGYSILLSEKSNTPITHSDDVRAGDKILAKLGKGELKLRVEEINNQPNN